MSHSTIRGPAVRDSHIEATVTKQQLHVKLEPKAFLLLLPDSVSPFRGSRYVQAQRFVLPPCRTASILILDWVNSGRGYRPPGSSPLSKTEDEEVWAMDSYSSVNEVLIGDRLLMRERMVLDNNRKHTSTLPLSSVATRLAPYNVYATVLLLGPHVAPLVAHLNRLTDKTSQFQLPGPPWLTWSYSNTDVQGGVLRVAAIEVEDARSWLREVFRAGGVRELVGDGFWSRVI
jgi:urease accessory protein